MLEWILGATFALLLLSLWRFRRSVSVRTIPSIIHCESYVCVQMVSNFPGLRLLVSPMSPPGLLLPALPFPLLTYPGFSFPWELKHAGLFAKFKCDTVSLCAGDGRAMLFTADVPFIQKMSAFASREMFPKPVDEYKVLSYLGSNLVICEGESWRRQRRIGAPAFSKGMFERLWLDMRDIVREMIEQERWQERTEPTHSSSTVSYNGYTAQPGEVLVPHVVDLTLRMALAAIARAGFGMDFEWEAEESFTKVCQEFGNPHRPHWWLTILSWTYGFIDPLVAPVYHLRDQFADIVPSALGAAVTYIWASWPVFPLRFVWALAAYWISELFTLFARPTEVDWNPRKIKVHEALHLVAKDSTLRLAIPPVRLTFCCMKPLLICDIVDDESAPPAYASHEAGVWHTRGGTQAAHRRAQDVSPPSIARPGATRQGPTPRRTIGSIEQLGQGGDDGRRRYRKGPGRQLGLWLDPKGTHRRRNHWQHVHLLPVSALLLYWATTDLLGSAGHETTAHSLAWTLALLAAYPEYQEEAIREIYSVWPSTAETFEPFYENTTMDDYAKFPYILACYAETLRLFPPVQMIPKIAAKDTCISVETSNELHTKGEKETDPLFERNAQTEFVIKKDTIIMIDSPGVREYHSSSCRLVLIR